MREDHQKERPKPDKKQAQQSALEGPAAYAPHDEAEKLSEIPQDKMPNNKPKGRTD